MKNFLHNIIQILQMMSFNPLAIIFYIITALVVIIFRIDLAVRNFGVSIPWLFLVSCLVALVIIYFSVKKFFAVAGDIEDAGFGVMFKWGLVFNLALSYVLLAIWQFISLVHVSFY